jgi:Tol biopolymer transport system component
VAWSAKGNRIACSARAGGQSDLLTLAPDGTAGQKVLSTPEPVESLCWAPDGRSLLLGSTAGGNARLRIVALNGTVQALGAGLDGRQFPQWIQNSARTPAGPSSHYPVPAVLGPNMLP